LSIAWANQEAIARNKFDYGGNVPECTTILKRIIDFLRKIWRAWRVQPAINRIATTMLRPLVVLGLPADPMLEHLPLVGIVKYKLPNGQLMSFRSYGDDYLLNLIFWKGSYEPETASLFFNLAGRSNCTVDAGAHVGFYTLMASYANPHGQVIAFEPFPRTHARLEENVRLNGRSNVRCVAAALGGATGSAELCHVADPGIPSNSSLRLLDPFDMRCQRTTVPLAMLDDFANKENLPTIDLIKMDTEGTEADVLVGMRERLCRDRPFIICEVLKGVAEVVRLEGLLQPLGYRYYLLSPNGPLLTPKIRPVKDRKSVV
jgi:FkbM family methyltransferase